MNSIDAEMPCRPSVYSALRHYLQAVKDIDSDDPAKVMAQMKMTPVSDACTPRQYPGGSARGARPLSRAGQEPGGIEGDLGLCQADRNDSARPGIPAFKPKQMQLGKDTISRKLQPTFHS